MLCCEALEGHAARVVIDRDRVTAPSRYLLNAFVDNLLVSHEGIYRYGLNKYGMRWNELTEAPLGDFALYGDRENEGSFEQGDVRAMNSEKWLTKVKSYFSRTPFTFNVYAYNAPEGKFYPFRTDAGDKDTEKSTRNFQQYFRSRINHRDRAHLEQVLDTEFPRSREAINIILTDNEGDERVGLTPWILAHRVAHAVLQDRIGRDAGEDNWQIRQLVSALVSVLVNARQAGDPSKIFKFRSARTESIAREGEYYVEMFTQYIVQGSLSVNAPPAEVPEFNFGLGHFAEVTAGVFEEAIVSIQRGEVPTRGDLKFGIADRMGVSIEELKIDPEAFLDAYFELTEYDRALRGGTDLNKSVATANKMMGEFLEECVGGTFILGAVRYD